MVSKLVGLICSRETISQMFRPEAGRLTEEALANQQAGQRFAHRNLTLRPDPDAVSEIDWGVLPPRRFRVRVFFALTPEIFRDWRSDQARCCSRAASTYPGSDRRW